MYQEKEFLLFTSDNSLSNFFIIISSIRRIPRQRPKISPYPDKYSLNNDLYYKKDSRRINN